MIKNLVFYNHWQNGDIHVSREFIKLIMNNIKAENYVYVHNKSKELLKDIPNLKISNEGIEYLDNDSPRMWNLHTRTLCLNTWYGVSRSFKDTSSCTIDTLFDLFSDHIKYITNNGYIDPSNIRKLVPKVDYEKYDIDNIMSYIENSKSKKVLICNGAVVSKQAKNFSFNNIVEEIAIRYKNIDFLMTEKFKTSIDNIKFTSDIISKNNTDLNEIGYLSTFCDVIIGRSSGPYIYSMVEENLFDAKKTFLCFSDDQEIANWSNDKELFSCKTMWSNDYQKEKIIEKIIESIGVDIEKT